MRDLRLLVGIGGAVLAAGAVSGCGKASAQIRAQDKPADRDIQLTIYKDDFGMVSERRSVNVDGGHSKISLDDVSKVLDPKSILIDWPNAQSHPQVMSTTYNLGTGSGANLISRLSGQEVQLMWPSQDGKQGELVSGRLESPDGGGFALRTRDRLYVNPTGTIVASAQTASTLPQLSVEVNSGSPEKTRLGMSYLTRGMSWSADYVAKLNSNSNTAELECWATVTNTTGIPFPSAKLTLMAGSLNRAVSLALNPNTVVGGETDGTGMMQEPGKRKIPNSEGFLNGAPPKPNAPAYTMNVGRSEVGELYAYDIPSRATIDIDQMNRVSVLGTRTVPIKRLYTVNMPTLSSSGYLSNMPYSAERPHVQATFAMSFVNDPSSNLGIPLPSGDVRVYEKDKSGDERFIGAATIADTPKGEHVSLTLSNAFDVYGSYKVLKSERVSKHKVRKTVEALVFNEKKTPVEARIVQGFDSAWSPVSESVKSGKIDSQTIEWKVPLKPGEEKKLDFVVELKE